MAKPASNSLFLFFLSLVPICSSGRFGGLHAEVDSLEKLHNFPLSQRQLLKNHYHLVKTLHDTISPPTTIFPATPVSVTPVTIPPDTSTPTIVTVPVFNPVTDFPTNPATPAMVPSTTTPSINPITGPTTVPGAQPLTSPVTTYPTPSGNVPGPVVTPPAIAEQSWCVAKSGALETALQAALDYACGIGGADCSQIKLSGSCYNPDTVENHASYAFNSYYQKNPVLTSCDFGGTAVIVNINPSTSSCIYPVSSSSATPSSSLPLVPASTTPIQAPTTTIPTPTTTSPAGIGVSGYGTPPTVLNTSNPALGSGTTTDLGSESPPGSNSSASSSAKLRPLSSCITLLITLVTREIILGCRLVTNCRYT